MSHCAVAHRGAIGSSPIGDGSSTMANAVMRAFGIESLSSSQVSRAAKLLDDEHAARAATARSVR